VFGQHKLRTVLQTASESAEVLPEFTLSEVFTGWILDPLPFVISMWAIGLYTLGVVTLRRRGDSWPWGRTFVFIGIAMGSFIFATLSGLGKYDTTLLSVHMVQHMILSMVVPLAMALGAPVTLALRTLPARPRNWLLAVVHSRVAKVLSFPPLAFLLYVTGPWALYFTSWYDASLASTYVHEMMHVHLVLVGTLFFWPLMGVDPVPGRVAYPFRVLLVVMTLPFHAFLGITIMDQTTLIGEGHYLALREGPMGTWLGDPFADQHTAGGILWASGDLIGVGFFVVLFIQWVRSSMKEAEREDRRLDRLERQSARQDDRMAR
jgi:cytochrome c oxidase assembly factor CtaG